jgi:hypothetical protein
VAKTVLMSSFLDGVKSDTSPDAVNAVVTIVAGGGGRGGGEGGAGGEGGQGGGGRGGGEGGGGGRDGGGGGEGGREGGGGLGGGDATTQLPLSTVALGLKLVAAANVQPGTEKRHVVTNPAVTPAT